MPDDVLAEGTALRTLVLRTGVLRGEERCRRGIQKVKSPYGVIGS
ncbi:MAG: hypothetical protein ACKOZW_07135 [Cyanobium sp.]